METFYTLCNGIFVRFISFFYKFKWIGHSCRNMHALINHNHVKYELQYTTSLYKVTCFADTFLPQYQDVNRSFHFLVVLIMSHLYFRVERIVLFWESSSQKKRESNLHKLYVYMHRRQHKVLLVNSNVMSTLNHWSACITFITVRKKKFRF